MDTIPIIIVNYKTPWHLKNCLKSIFRHTKDFKIFLVHNSPDPESIKIGNFFKSKYPNQIEIITHSRNLGLVGGINSVFQKVINYKYICLLNSDIIVTPNWLSTLEKALEENKNVVQVSPDSNQFYQEKFINRIIRWQIMSRFPKFGGQLYLFFLRLNLPRSQNIQNSFRKSTKFYEFCTGACNLFRSEFFQKLGYICDPKIVHGYGDDFDLSYYLRQFGEIGAVDSSYVIHFVNASFNKIDPKKNELKLKLQFINRLYVVHKWRGRIEKDIKSLGKEEIQQYLKTEDFRFILSYFGISVLNTDFIEEIKKGNLARNIGEELGIG